MKVNLLIEDVVEENGGMGLRLEFQTEGENQEDSNALAIALIVGHMVKTGSIWNQVENYVAETNQTAGS